MDWVQTLSIHTFKALVYILTPVILFLTSHLTIKLYWTPLCSESMSLHMQHVMRFLSSWDELYTYTNHNPPLKPN